MICKRNLRNLNGQNKPKKAFNDIKELLIGPPVLKASTPNGLFHLESDTSQEGVGSNGLFHLESDTSQEGVGGTLLQKQGNEWVVIGYHSKRLPQSAKNLALLN